MAPQAGEGQALVGTDKPVPMDGSTAVEERRRKRHLMYCGLMAAYVLGGMLFYYLVEGWNALESFVFILSILTGCGYGHLIPASSLGLLATSFYILAGLVLFASLAGQLLEFIMELEISAVMDAVKSDNADDAAADTSYKIAHKLDKKHQFKVGCINLAILSVGAVLVFKFAFGEGLVDSIYLSSVAVLKMDSACLLDGVVCSHGRHSHSGGTAHWLLFAVFWYVLTYGIIGHFMVSASNYFGVDPESSVSQIKTLSHERLKRMDNDGDGKVTREEFLRDRLIQDGLCAEEAIDSILKNFEHLDKDGSGHLNKRDLSQRSSD